MWNHDGGFPSQMACSAESVSMSRRHRGLKASSLLLFRPVHADSILILKANNASTRKLTGINSHCQEVYEELL